MLFDLGAHLVDQAIVLFGPPERVYAEVLDRGPRSGGNDDTFLALHHADGVVSHLWMSTKAPHQGPRFRVLGSEAAYVKHGLDVQEVQAGQGLDPAPRAGESSPRRPGASSTAAACPPSGAPTRPSTPSWRPRCGVSAGCRWIRGIP